MKPQVVSEFLDWESFSSRQSNLDGLKVLLRWAHNRRDQLLETHEGLQEIVLRIGERVETVVIRYNEGDEPRQTSLYWDEFLTRKQLY